MSFVSHSVEGLETNNVTIMDVNGNLLSQGIAEEGTAATGNITVSQIALQQKYEQELSRSIQSMLEQMRGSGKVVVRAKVSMDFDQVETYSEQYGNSVLASEQVKEESSTGTSTIAGENPADSNMEGTTYGEIGTEGVSAHDLVERTRNYEVSKMVETKVVAPGKVTRVSVSVILDGEITDAEQALVSEAVGKAAGLDFERGDQVSIVAMPFNTEELEKIEVQIAEAEKAAARKDYITMGLYGLGIIVAAGLIVFIFRSLKNILSTQLVPSMETVPSAAPTPREMNIALSPEAAAKKMKREQVDQLVESNPEDVAKVIKTWMLEE
jgi:flagellar M-ring protein FliF